MELRRLRYFVATSEELHMGRAAERLGIAQPALSQQLKVLETSLGVRLFQRVGRGIGLSPAGQVFLPEARAAIAQTDLAWTAARRAASGEQGCIVIGYVGSAMLEPALPQAIGAFHQRWPDVSIELEMLPVRAQLDALRESRLDLAFVRGVGATLEWPLKASVMRHHPTAVALPIDHPQAARRKVPIASLIGESFMVLQDSSLPGYFAETTLQLCRAAGFEPSIGMHVPEINALLALVAAGLGISLVPGSLGHLGNPRLALVPLAGVDERMDLLVVQRVNRPSIIVDNFLRAMQPLRPQKR